METQLWKDYLKALKKYIKVLDKWIKEQGEVTTQDDGPGTLPPNPPPPPPLPGN